MNDAADRRAARLARLYPRRWRRQYPDFVEVLADHLRDDPRGLRRDVARAGAVERLRAAGVLPSGPDDRARSGLALMYAALIPFVGLTMGMWSQLHTGLAARGLGAGPVLRVADVLLALGTLLTFVALVVGMVLIVAHARPRPRRFGGSGVTRRWPPIGPALTFVVSFAVLSVAGAAADRSGWYSPAALALPARGAGHVVTLWVRAIVASITPAWIHPSLFARMPAGELAAAFLAPVAGLAAAGALLRMISALPIRAPGRLDVTLAVVTGAVMVLSATAAVRWILTHPTPQGATPALSRTDQLAPGHTAWGVVVVLLALAVTALVGMRRVLRGRRRPRRGSADMVPSAAAS